MRDVSGKGCRGKSKRKPEETASPGILLQDYSVVWVMGYLISRLMTTK
jgi:hypothetical protein